MRIARDGPMYGVIILVGLLALRGTTTAMESIVGAAFALLAFAVDLIIGCVDDRSEVGAAPGNQNAETASHSGSM